VVTDSYLARRFTPGSCLDLGPVPGVLSPLARPSCGGFFWQVGYLPSEAPRAKEGHCERRVATFGNLIFLGRVCCPALSWPTPRRVHSNLTFTPAEVYCQGRDSLCSASPPSSLRKANDLDKA
jgi:hypothetical protein